MISSEKKHSFLIGFLIFLIAVLFYFIFYQIFSLRIDFVLVALGVLALFLRLEEILFLSFLGIFIFSWQSIWSPEMILFLVLPLLIFGLNIFLPGKKWFSGLVGVLITLLVFYSLINFSLFFSGGAVFLTILIPGLSFGGLVFWFLNSDLINS